MKHATLATSMIRIQMVGTQRSGSNLLRLMLDSGGALLAPASAHELRDFLPLVSMYEPLSDPVNQERLAGDIIHLVRMNALAWPKEHLDKMRLLDRLEGYTLPHFVLALYDQAAACAFRSGWVNKCLENVHYVDLLEATGASLLYIHLVRDPRDVALSFSRAPIGPKDPRVIAALWCEDQRAAMQVTTRFASRVVRIRFEDLVRGSAKTLDELAAWLGIPRGEGALRYYEREDAAEAAALSPIWENLRSKPIGDRAEAYVGDAGSAQFVRRVEEIAFDDMKEFGYEPAYARSVRRMSEDESASALENDSHLRVAAAAAHADRDQSAHLRREWFLDTLRGHLSDSGCAEALQGEIDGRRVREA